MSSSVRKGRVPLVSEHMSGMKRHTAEDLHRAQCARDGLEPRPLAGEYERIQYKFQDAAVSGRGVALEPWHTDLVHVLWDHGIKGQSADDLASAIRSSVYDDARRAHDQIAILDRVMARIENGEDPVEAMDAVRRILVTGSES